MFHLRESYRSPAFRCPCTLYGASRVPPRTLVDYSTGNSISDVKGLGLLIWKERVARIHLDSAVDTAQRVFSRFSVSDGYDRPMSTLFFRPKGGWYEISFLQPREVSLARKRKRQQEGQAFFVACHQPCTFRAPVKAYRQRLRNMPTAWPEHVRTAVGGGFAMTTWYVISCGHR